MSYISMGVVSCPVGRATAELWRARDKYRICPPELAEVIGVLAESVIAIEHLSELVVQVAAAAAHQAENADAPAEHLQQITATAAAAQYALQAAGGWVEATRIATERLTDGLSRNEHAQQQSYEGITS